MVVYVRPLGVYIRSLGLVSWIEGVACAPTGGVLMAVESLSGSWSAQVPERPTAAGSRLVYPTGGRPVWSIVCDSALSAGGLKP